MIAPSTGTRPVSTKSSSPNSAKPDRQVANRWTESLARAGWTPISDYFLSNYFRLKMSHLEAMVVIHLIRYKWDQDAPYPRLATIAEQMGISIPSVRSHLRSLEKKKLVLRHQPHAGATNRFYFDGLFDALEDLMDKDRETAATEAARVVANRLAN